MVRYPGWCNKLVEGVVACQSFNGDYSDMESEKCSSTSAGGWHTNNGISIT